MSAENFPVLVAFLYHLQRGYLPAAEVEHLESLAIEGLSLEDLQAVDPFTLASAAALAERLLGGGEGEGETADDDLCGVDRPSVGEREDERDGD